MRSPVPSNTFFKYNMENAPVFIVPPSISTKNKYNKMFESLVRKFMKNIRDGNIDEHSYTMPFSNYPITYGEMAILLLRKAYYRRKIYDSKKR